MGKGNSVSVFIAVDTEHNQVNQLPDDGSADAGAGSDHDNESHAGGSVRGLDDGGAAHEDTEDEGAEQDQQFEDSEEDSAAIEVTDSHSHEHFQKEGNELLLLLVVAVASGEGLSFRHEVGVTVEAFAGGGISTDTVRSLTVFVVTLNISGDQELLIGIDGGLNYRRIGFDSSGSSSGGGRSGSSGGRGGSSGGRGGGRGGGSLD